MSDYRNNRPCSLIKFLKAGDKDVDVLVIVLDIGNPVKTRLGHQVRTVRVADKSGSIDLSLWNTLGLRVRSSDILHLSKIYVSLFKGRLTLNLNKSSGLVKLGEFCLIFSELPNMSEESTNKPSIINH